MRFGGVEPVVEEDVCERSVDDVAGLTSVDVFAAVVEGVVAGVEDVVVHPEARSASTNAKK